MADGELARGAARPRWFERHGIAFVSARPARSDRALAGVDPRRTAENALPQLPHCLDSRHIGLDRASCRRRLPAAVGFPAVDQFITPIANAVLVLVLLLYVWRLITHKPR
jgi:hypothetical protein